MSVVEAQVFLHTFIFFLHIPCTSVSSRVNEIVNSKIVNIDSFYYNSNFSYEKTNIPGLTLFKWKKAKFGGSHVEGFCRIVCTAVDTDVVDDDDDDCVLNLHSGLWCYWYT